MNYKESQEILVEINKAKKILLACHQGVDPDSITSNLLLKTYLEIIGKEADIVIADEIPDVYRMFDGENKIKQKIDFSKFDFSKYDLFLTCDVNGLKRLGIEDLKVVGDIKIINIDHHEGVFDGTLYISDTSYSCTAEMIFYLLDDFGFKFDKDSAELVLSGIISDTDSFDYGISPRVFKTVSRLIELGADYDKIKFWLLRNNSELQLKFWSKILVNLHVDYENKFAYTYMSHKEFKGFEGVVHPTRTASDMFIRTIKDTDFGMAMLEETKGELKISIRSRQNNYGVVDLCRQLGGGGHFNGGGAMVAGLPFEKAVKKVLETARKYAKENKI